MLANNYTNELVAILIKRHLARAENNTIDAKCTFITSLTVTIELINDQKTLIRI